MGKFIDLTGRRFKMLVVIGRGKNDKFNNIIWECLCDCGKTALIRNYNLKSGHTKSCGCLKLDFLTNTDTTQAQKVYQSKAFNGTNIYALNQNVRSDSHTGVKGIYYNKKRNKFEAHIRLKGKQYHLGRYNKIEDAIKARKQAEEELFQPIIEEYKDSHNSHVKVLQ